MSNFSSNPGEVHFEDLVYLLRYIKDNMNLGLGYYANIEYAPLSDLLIQAIINIENLLMVFHDYICQNCLYTGRSTGEYIVFYQVVRIDHWTHVTSKVDQSSAESEYNAECTAGMDIAHFRMLINELLKKDIYVAP